MSEPSSIFRYPGIQPFSSQQKDLFFGRDDDRDQLLSLILLEKLTVLFGKSGYGKSSLLQAGIAPALEKENQRGKRIYVPVFIRFHSRLSNEQYNWFDWFAFHLDQHISNPEKAPCALPNTIWGELKRRQTDANQVFVLIFDQFEELFTYPPEQVEAFKNQLADLLFADIPDYLEHHEDDHSAHEVAWMSQKLDARAVIAVRADRLSELDQLKDSLPAILNKRYELRALSREQAKEALEKPAELTGTGYKSPAFTWQPEAIQKIMNDLSRNRQGREAGIEAFHLQVLAQHIENRVIQGEVPDRDADGKPDVGLQDLPDIDRLYEGFYEEALTQLKHFDRKKARRLIEHGLIFEGDMRIPLHEKLIRRDYKVDTVLIQQLIDLRLLRAEPSTSGGRNIELSHDAFVQPILNAVRRRKQDRWRRTTMALGALLGIVLLFIVSFYTFRAPAPSDLMVIRENAVLTQQLDSLKVIQTQEQQVRDMILKYFDCVNNHDIACISAFSKDTMLRYHQVENVSRSYREKLERDYFRRHASEKIAEVKEVTVTKTDRGFDVTASTIFQYEKKGLTPVIFQIQLDRDLKIFYLRSFIASD